MWIDLVRKITAPINLVEFFFNFHSLGMISKKCYENVCIKWLCAATHKSFFFVYNLHQTTVFRLAIKNHFRSDVWWRFSCVAIAAARNKNSEIAKVNKSRNNTFWIFENLKLVVDRILIRFYIKTKILFTEWSGFYWVGVCKLQPWTPIF